MRYSLVLLFAFLFSSSFAQTLTAECGVLYNHVPNGVVLDYPGGKPADVVVTADSGEVKKVDDTFFAVTPRVKSNTITLYIRKPKGKATPVQFNVKITKKPVVEFSAGGAVTGKDNYFELKARDIKFNDYPPTIHISFPTDCKVGAYRYHTDQPVSFDVTVNGKNFSCKSTYSLEVLNEIRKFKSGKIIYTNIITSWNNNQFKIAKAEVLVK